MNRFLAIVISCTTLFVTLGTLHAFAQSSTKNTQPTATPTHTFTQNEQQLQRTPTTTATLAISQTLVTSSRSISDSLSLSTTPTDVAPLTHIVTYGDSLLEIATKYGVTINDLVTANPISDPDLIHVGQELIIPGHTVTAASDSPNTVTAESSDISSDKEISRPTITKRMTEASQALSPRSPFYKKTWLTYYGRPNVPVMGILGEHEISDLVELLDEKSASYDEANGVDLGVVSAFHLVYGMATWAPGEDGSHLAFMPDSQVTEYISAALESNFQVILDIQIGALTPADALEYGLPWLKYDNVHLALDPEFALVYAGQTVPGNPAGYVTAEQINEAQATMQHYIQKNKIKGKRVLLLHQFLDTMIVSKAELANDFAGIELAISVDGWGPPAGKVSKYNQFVDETVHFSSFKLFYRWDDPLMSERQALGEESINGYDYIEVTPNMIIYQ